MNLLGRFGDCEYICEGSAEAGCCHGAPFADIVCVLMVVELLNDFDDMIVLVLWLSSSSNGSSGSSGSDVLVATNFRMTISRLDVLLDREKKKVQGMRGDVRDVYTACHEPCPPIHSLNLLCCKEPGRGALRVDLVSRQL